MQNRWLILAILALCVNGPAGAQSLGTSAIVDIAEMSVGDAVNYPYGRQGHSLTVYDSASRSKYGFDDPLTLLVDNAPDGTQRVVWWLHNLSVGPWTKLSVAPLYDAKTDTTYIAASTYWVNVRCRINLYRLDESAPSYPVSAMKVSGLPLNYPTSPVTSKTFDANYVTDLTASKTGGLIVVRGTYKGSLSLRAAYDVDTNEWTLLDGFGARNDGERL